MSKLIMLIGCAGSGKSTIAKEINKIEENSKIFSSDQLRQELYGDSSDQSHNSEIFQILQQRVRQFLSNGGTAIYDATNLNRKYRCIFLQSIPTSVRKECIVVLATEETCCHRQQIRSRKVPYEVIHRQLISFQVPTYREGWQAIIIRRTDNGYLASDLTDLSLEIAHDNPHHLDTIGEHNMAVAKNLKSQDDVTCLAALWHDIGKCFTKHFDDNGVAHYYGHAAYGSYVILLINDLSISTQQSNLIEVAFYIEHHMDLFDIRTQEQFNLWADKNHLSAKDVLSLKDIHTADIKCSEQDQEWLEGKGNFYGNLGN